MAEITAQNRPPGGNQQDGQQGGQPPQERRALSVPEKKQALSFMPALMEMLQVMARPMLEQDLESYLEQQRERVLSRAKAG